MLLGKRELFEEFTQKLVLSFEEAVGGGWDNIMATQLKKHAHTHTHRPTILRYPTSTRLHPIPRPAQHGLSGNPT
jgi:hypothetical protein